MTTFRDALLALEKRATTDWEPTRQIIRAEIVTQDGSVNVSGRPGFVWVKSDDRPGGRFQVFNPAVQAREGMPVILGFGHKPPARLQILSVDWTLLPGIADYDGDPYLANHASTHEMPDGAPGPDAIHVYPRALVPLKVYGSSSLTVDVAPLRYDHNGTVTTFYGYYGLDLSAHQPASGSACYVLVYLDTTDNTINSTAGSTTGDSPGYNPPYPTVPANSIPSALVRLDGDQTTITEADIVDVRQLFSRVGLDGDGWPFNTEICGVDGTDYNADYDNLSDAISGSSKDVIEISPGSFTSDDLTGNADQVIRGKSIDKTVLSPTAGTYSVLSMGDGGVLQDLTVENKQDRNGTYIYGVEVPAHVSAILRDVKIDVDNTDGAAGDCIALRIVDDADVIELFDVEILADATDSSYALGIMSSSNGVTVYVNGGIFDNNNVASGSDIYVGSNSTAYLRGPTLVNGKLGRGVTNATIYGWWYDGNGDMHWEDGVDLTVEDGDLTVEAGDVTITAGDVIVTAGDVLIGEGYASHDDGETGVYNSLWARRINQIGLAVWTTHCREGSGLPTGFDGWVTTPSSIYVAQNATYTGYVRDTWYRSYSSSATLRCWLADYSASPITTQSNFYARLAVMSGCEIGLRVDNFDSDASYNVGDRMYYYEIYLTGTTMPVTQLGYRHGYFVWDGAAWTGPTETTGGPTTIGPLGMELMLRVYINYGASNNTCAGYLVDEVTTSTGAYGSVVMYVGAGITPFGAHRAGVFWRLNGYANSAFDLAYLSWV